MKDGGEYYIAHSPSKVNWVALRGFLVDGKPDASSKMFREGFKIYSLAKKDNPPKMEFVDCSKEVFNTVHANNIEVFDPELRGLAASIVGDDEVIEISAEVALVPGRQE